eukprot:8029484-Alexandrium_andersonii.AAC.1
MARRGEPSRYPHEVGECRFERPPVAVHQPALGGWPALVCAPARPVQLGLAAPGWKVLGVRARDYRRRPPKG